MTIRLYSQRGAALILMMALISMGASWMLVSSLNAATKRTAFDRAHNARVLAEAKSALVAWVAINALESTENSPGRLPCPQAWGDVGNPVNEGRAAGSCSATAAGWLPWRTLGIQKPLDAAGNQIWYVISPGWHLPNTTTKLSINSNTTGQISVDGQAAVALLIAPGAPLGIAPNANQLAAGCVARNQSQALNLPSVAPNPLDFLDCQNGSTADNVFTASVVDNPTNPVLNDQVLKVTTADILPALEASISKRIERDIVPQLKSVYAGAEWGLSPDNPVFPFAAPFAHQGPGAGTSPYRGTAGVFEGLLPFNQTQSCTEAASDPRCTTATTGPTAFLVFSKMGNDASFGSGSIRTQSTCNWQSNVYVCTGEYNAPSISVTLRLNVANVAMGLRALDTSKVTCSAVDDVGSGLPTQSVGCTVSVILLADGSAMLTVTTSALPVIEDAGWGTYANYSVRFDRAVIGDHALLTDNDPPSCSTIPSPLCTGWFVRNEWFRLLYYATTPSHAASASPPRSCSGGATPTCLQVTNVTPANEQRAILILAGRSLSGAARPNATLADFVEGSNAATPPKTVFERRPVNSSFNDRVLVIDANPS